MRVEQVDGRLGILGYSLQRLEYGGGIYLIIALRILAQVIESLLHSLHSLLHLGTVVLPVIVQAKQHTAKSHTNKGYNQRRSYQVCNLASERVLWHPYPQTPLSYLSSIYKDEGHTTIEQHQIRE